MVVVMLSAAALWQERDNDPTTVSLLWNRRNGSGGSPQTPPPSQPTPGARRGRDVARCDGVALPKALKGLTLVSVAERRGAPVADPLRQRYRAGQFGVGQQVALVELLGIEADRAHIVAAARVREALEQVGSGGQPSQATPVATPSIARRTASLVTNMRLGRPCSAAPTATRKATVTAFRVFEAGRQADDCFARHGCPLRVGCRGRVPQRGLPAMNA